MVREGTGNNVARGSRRHPNKRHSTKVNSGGNGTIRSGPSETSRVGMQVPPNVDNTTSVKQSSKTDRTLAPSDKGIRATAILRPIENGIKVTHNQSGDRRINPIRNIHKELIPLRVAVRSIETADTKRLAVKREFTLKIATICVSPRVHKGQRGTI